MHRKLKALWDRHEGWAAPLAMVFFLLTGLQVGTKMGVSQTQVANAETIRSMQAQLESKDQVIADKDARLRALQTEKGVIGNTAAKSADAAAEAARAAVMAAEAANRSAESAANLKNP